MANPWRILRIAIILAGIILLILATDVVFRGGDHDFVLLTPTGSFAGVQKAGNTTEKVFFDSFNKDVKPSDIEIAIVNQTGTGSSTYTMPTTDLSGNLTSVARGTLTGVGSIAYTDLAQDKKISNQDYITIQFTFPVSGSMSYKVSMIYVLTDSVIDSITFYW
ncbi:MAG: hypothetical protein ABSB83_05840 [Methanomassiliicoccales archaeon]